MEENNTIQTEEAKSVNIKKFTSTFFADLIAFPVELIKRKLCGNFIENILDKAYGVIPWVMTSIIAIIPIIFLILAIKRDSMIIFLVGLLGAFGLALVQFLAKGFGDAIKKLKENASCKLSNDAFPTVVGVLYMISSLALLVVGVGCIVMKSIEGLSFCVFAVVLFLSGCAYMSKNIMNIEISETTTPGQELIALASYLVNGIVISYPLVTIALGVCVIIDLIASVFAYHMQEIEVFALVGLAFTLAFLPIIFYILYLFYYFFIDLCKAVLSLLDRK